MLRAENFGLSIALAPMVFVVLNAVHALSAHPAGALSDRIGLLEACDGWKDAVFPLHGQDAFALGVPEAPRIGELLAEAETWWEDGDYAAGREACLKKLKSLLAQGRR